MAGLGVCMSTVATFAYLAPTSTNVENYYNNIKEYAGYAIAVMSQVVLQTLVQAVIKGVAQGVSKRVERRIAGPDVTIARV